MITSREHGDSYEVAIAKNDFESGGLRAESFVRYCHLFSIDENIIEYQAGKLKETKSQEIITKIIAMLTS